MISKVQNKMLPREKYALIGYILLCLYGAWAYWYSEKQTNSNSKHNTPGMINGISVPADIFWYGTSEELTVFLNTAYLKNEIKIND